MVYRLLNIDIRKIKFKGNQMIQKIYKPKTETNRNKRKFCEIN